ncbi:acireductone dioxygenase apoprotein [Pseudomonas sp. NFACC49-2]|uniref:1,2-dihydroxy-3-keto-5-methylthiopentene dioxygenase n=1 Tax=Pseudomonas sp. NFACC49-2 TaxID=1566222 RepID=UPI0009225960|nr:acireductone dioxygenase [Pseudomonas sp. NFACC49-2]SFY13240.1 acireductone dioxygenase apoprotein [Pseudomonas sp. NFACC49-2]
MSSLSVYHLSSPDIPNKVLTHFEDIAATLAEKGVRFERWQAATKIQPDATHDEIIAAYRPRIEQWMGEEGLCEVEVISLDNDHPQKDEVRARLLEEHHYEQDDVRFFVAGRGLFSLHVDDYIYAVLCEKNDLISVPAGTSHWFDMGEQPYYVTLRLFKDQEKRAARFTGNDIASRFPRLED